MRVLLPLLLAVLAVTVCSARRYRFKGRGGLNGRGRFNGRDRFSGRGRFNGRDRFDRFDRLNRFDQFDRNNRFNAFDQFNQYGGQGGLSSLSPLGSSFGLPFGQRNPHDSLFGSGVLGSTWGQSLPLGSGSFKRYKRSLGARVHRQFLPQVGSQYDLLDRQRALGALSPLGARPLVGSQYDLLKRNTALGALSPVGAQLGRRDPFDPYCPETNPGGLVPSWNTPVRTTGFLRRFKRSYGQAARRRLMDRARPQYEESLPMKTKSSKTYLDGLIKSRYPGKRVADPAYPGDTIVKQVPVPVAFPVPVPVGPQVSSPLGPQGFGPQDIPPVGPFGPRGSFPGPQGPFSGPQGPFSGPQGPVPPFRQPVPGLPGSFLPGPTNLVNGGAISRQFPGREDFPNVNSWVWPNRRVTQPLLEPGTDPTIF